MSKTNPKQWNKIHTSKPDLPLCKTRLFEDFLSFYSTLSYCRKICQNSVHVSVATLALRSRVFSMHSAVHVSNVFSFRTVFLIISLRIAFHPSHPFVSSTSSFVSASSYFGAIAIVLAELQWNKSRLKNRAWENDDNPSIPKDKKGNFSFKIKN